ncbi:MAG TPA: hypothetical protein VG206_20740 [Terriglobia bacterium]|nr:hypothetical protein [Terriglobia bacterium]
MFSTTSTGSTWTTLLSGLPNVAVMALNVYKLDRTLWVASHGSKMWSVTVSGIE